MLWKGIQMHFYKKKKKQCSVSPLLVFMGECYQKNQKKNKPKCSFNNMHCEEHIKPQREKQREYLIL